MNTPERLRQLLQKEENQKLALQEDLILEVTDRICRVMEERGLSRADLAKKLGTSRANVTKMLSGEQNMTLRTLADVFFVFGKRIAVHDVPFHPEQLLDVGHREGCPAELVLKFDPRQHGRGEYRLTDVPAGEIEAIDKVAG